MIPKISFWAKMLLYFHLYPVLNATAAKTKAMLPVKTMIITAQDEMAA